MPAASSPVTYHHSVRVSGWAPKSAGKRIARAGFGVAQAAEGDTRVHLRDWELAREGPADASRYLARVQSEAAGFGFELAFTTTQPVLLQGDAGFSRKGPAPEQFSRYYSQPQMKVEGRLTLDGRAAAVTGRAWESPVSQARYPVAWRIDTPAGSHTLEAEFEAQELDSRASTGNFYWEGLSTLGDANGRRIGRGYLEMSGYATRLKL